MLHTTYPLPRPGGLRHHQRELLPTAANRAESLYLTRPAGWTDRAGLAVCLPKISSVQVKRHASTRGECRRGGRFCGR